MMKNDQFEQSRLLIGISSCLLGNEVRYDGAHSRSNCILESMNDLFELTPFCPEVAIGLGIPRPPIQLVDVDGRVRVRSVSNTRHDVTDELTVYVKDIKVQLDRLSGYIFKSKSPSCGLIDVNVYDVESNEIVGASAGQFAKIVMRQYPELPVEDDVRLLDKKTRDDFIKRVQAYSQRKQ